MEQQIKQLETIIRMAIGNSKLNVSIVELILRNIYTEVKTLADENLRSKIAESEKQKEEESDGNTDEEG